MGGKRWQTPEQLNFIRKHIPAYGEAAKGSRKQLIRFWPILEAAWWGEFPLKDELVEKGVLSASVLEKGFEFVEGSSEEALYQKELNKRKEQIKTLIRYEYRQASLKSGISDPSRVAISTAAKNFVKPIRRCFQPQEMYYHLYKSEVDALFEAERAGLGGAQDGDGGETEDEQVEDEQGEGDDEKETKKGRLGRGWNLRLRRQIFTREWEKASPKRRAAVMEEIEKQKTQIAMESSLEETGKGLARDGDSRLGSLQRINAFWASNAKLCWDNAAMMSVQIGIAPDPSKGDKLVSMSISYGLDSNGKVFQDAFPNFHEAIVKPIITWAKANVFTQKNWEKAKAERAASRQAGQDDKAEGGERKAGLAPPSQGGEAPKNQGPTTKDAVAKGELCAKGNGEEQGNEHGEDEGKVDDNNDNDSLGLSDSFDAVHQLQPVSSEASSPVSSAQAEPPTLTGTSGGPPAPTGIVHFPGTPTDRKDPPANPAHSLPSNPTHSLPSNPTHSLPSNPAHSLPSSPAQPPPTNPTSHEAPAPPPLQPDMLPSGNSLGRASMTQVSPQPASSPQAHAFNGMFGAMPNLFGKIVDSVPLQQRQGASVPVAPIPEENRTFLLPETRSPQYLITPGAMNQHPSSPMDPMGNASMNQGGFLGNGDQGSLGPGAGMFPFGDMGSGGQGLGGGGAFPFEDSMPRTSLSAYLFDDNMIDPPGFEGFHTYSHNAATLPPFYPDSNFAQTTSFDSTGPTFPLVSCYPNQLSGVVPAQAPGLTDPGNSPFNTSLAFGAQPTAGPVVTLSPSEDTRSHTVLDTLPAASTQPSHTAGARPAQGVTTPPAQGPLQPMPGTALTGVSQTLPTPTAPTAHPQHEVSAVPTPPAGVLAITTNAPAKPSAAQGTTKPSKGATTSQPTKPAGEGSQAAGEEPPVKPKPKPKPKPTRKRKSDVVETPTSDSVSEGRGKRTKTPAKRFDGENYVAVGPVNVGSRVVKAKGD